jgi:hypothetical protein
MARKFPMFASFLLLVGVVWLLEGLNIIRINLPWIPIILIIIAVGMIFNRFSKK